MAEPARYYTVEIGETKLRGESDEVGVRFEGIPGEIPLQDDLRLRSYSGKLDDGSEVLIYAEEGESEHEFTVYLRGEVIPVRVVTPRDERLLALSKNTAAGHSTA